MKRINVLFSCLFLLCVDDYETVAFLTEFHPRINMFKANEAKWNIVPFPPKRDTFD